MNSLTNFFSFMDRTFEAVIKTVLVLILLTMVFLGASQVFMRDLFAGGMTWSDVAARNMVLWVAFLGAILATRKRQHICIDAISRFLPKAPRDFVRIFLDTFSAIVAFYLTQASYAFVLSEKAMGGMAFGDVPTWIVQTIIPFGFAVICFQFAIGAIWDVVRLFGRGE